MRLSNSDVLLAWPLASHIITAGWTYNGNKAHTSQTGWKPENTPALWTEICETHDGNMALTAGLYYIQDYTIYLCTRDTGNPVYNPLAELVGIYVEIA